MHKEFSIENKVIGINHKPFIIAEVAQSHDGNLNIAHSFIDLCANAGADAIKFQTHIASEESTINDEWRIKFTHYNESRYEYWKRMEFSKEEWKGLIEHCKQKDIIFLSTPFSETAVDLLEDLGIGAWKLASGELSNIRMIDHIIKTGKPILISSGMSPWEEIDEVIERVKKNNNPFGLFQCNSSYPTPVEKVGLNIITEMLHKYNVPIGLSDHSATIFSPLAAITLGASIIEVHVTFHESAFGPDVPASLNPNELVSLVEGAKYIHYAKMNPIDKDKEAIEMQKMRTLFTRSMVAAKNLKKNHVITANDIVYKKPGGGISAKDETKVIGKELLIDIPRSEIIKWENLK
ncbi:N-acetylneuraminate synthase family protein [Gammaproteobacteria bacterium]|nr:N-acetylneuraminate synthase family protein [Gammaproteobacteria bacterium]